MNVTYSSGRVALAAVFVLWFAGLGCADLPSTAPPPPLIGSAGDWINSSPLTWGQLGGKVVLVDFMEYTCINCIRTFPYLRAWYERYHPYGFEIIGIHAPEFAFDQDPKLVAQAAKFYGLKYPILNDPNTVNWGLYNEQFWPSKYLFDQNGHLVEQHAGEGNYRETELEIQRLLKRTHPNAKFPAPLAYQQPGDAPNATCREDTPELYANPTRGFLGNLPSGWKQDRVTTFPDGKPKKSDLIYAQGPFRTRYQSLQHARTTTDLSDFVALRYRGTEVNVVLNRPNHKDYRVYATLDGKPVPPEFRGSDLKSDTRGTYLDVTFARMYNVIRGPYGGRTLRLASDSPEFDLYSYTFSGCPQVAKT